MNKLNLLEPRIKSYYTRRGKGQEIRYLDIDRTLSLEALKEDVLHGAKEFSELLQYVTTKKTQKFTIINAPSEEEGLMAVTYLAAIYNKADEQKDLTDGNDNQFGGQESENSYSNEKEEMGFDDDQEDYCFDQDEMIANGVNVEDDYDGDEWEESKWRLPVIPYEKLNQYENESISDMNHGSFVMGGLNNVNTEEPFWLSTRKEPICIVREAAFSGEFQFYCRTVGMVATLKRFKRNTHVYIVLISPKPTEDEDYYNYAVQTVEREACEVILEYLAGTVAIKAEQDELDKYRENLFENYIAAAKRKLAKGFPKSSVAKRIVSIDNPAKSSLINKVINYVISQYPEETVLKKEHFDVLANFKLLGVTEKKEEHKSAYTLEKEIVGLETVKQQINRIVNIMKYNKKREEMDLGKGEYHNVHLLIGAPGTAKTTVAQLLGQIMAEEKLLPGNRFRCVNGAELKGMFVGHSAPKVHALFEENDVILIDEAYSIVTEGEHDSFAEEAIAQLIIELEKHGTDKLVMFAGYGGKNVSDKNNKMKQFINANPGIRSRINSTIYFDSYSVEQMMDIFYAMTGQRKYVVEKGADEVLRDYFAQRIGDDNFGNGREVRSILENILSYAAERVMKLPADKINKKTMSLLKEEDVKKAVADALNSYELQKGRGKSVCGFTIG